MLADRANLGSLGANDQVAAVTALPHSNAALLKDGHGLHVAQQLAVALLVGLLNGSNATELLGQLMEAFLVGLTGHAVVHIGPLGVLALGGVEQVLGGIAQLAQSLEPQLGVFLLVLSGVQEQRGDLLVAGLLGDGGEVGVLVPGLTLTGKGFP